MKNLYSLLLFLPLFSLGQQTLFNCDGVDISNQSYSVTPSDASNDLLWSVSDQSGIDITVSVLTSGQNTDEAIINWSGVSAGVYTIQFTETNTAVPCEGSELLTVTIEDGSFSATASVVDVCEGTTEEQAPTITLTPTLSNVSYAWGSASTDNTDSAVLALSAMNPAYDGGSITTDTPLEGTVTITNEDNQCTFTLTTDFYNVVPNPDPSAITF